MHSEKNRARGWEMYRLFFIIFLSQFSAFFCMDSLISWLLLVINVLLLMCSLQEHIIGPLDACPKRQVPFPMLAFLPSSEMSGDLELIEVFWILPFLGHQQRWQWCWMIQDQEIYVTFGTKEIWGDIQVYVQYRSPFEEVLCKLKSDWIKRTSCSNI